MYQAKKEPRRKNDFYPTPDGVPLACLRVAVPDLFKGYCSVMDVGAGLGIWGQAISYNAPAVTLTGVEVNPEFPATTCYDTWHVGNYLHLDYELITERYDYVVGNPPFNIAEDCIRNGLKSLRKGGKLTFLLRLAYLESLGRGNGLFKEFPPLTVHVSSRRIPFESYDGTSASKVPFAMFTWEQGRTQGDTVIKWFDWKEDKG